jgi:hypothetical protein
MKRNLKHGTKQRRQISALERLEKQLLSGVKIQTILDVNGKSTITVELSDKDITRIKKEIQTLKSRI